jgi:hypothetical protein
VYTHMLEDIMYGDSYTPYVIVILAMLPVTLYHFLSETFMNGQSFGKKIVGIKVVKLDGTQPGVGSYALRALLRIIDVNLFDGIIGIITVAVSKKSQRLGDMAAGTTVIKLGARVTLNDTILYRPVADYKVVFDQVALLNDRDIAIIKDVLEYGVSNNKPEAIANLAQKVKAKIGIVSDLPNDAFLRTILLDYSHYQFEK